MSLFAYTVRSGSLNAVHKCPLLADAEAVALAVLESECVAGRAQTLGLLLSVSGGQYAGKDEMYFDTMALLRRLGRMEGE